MIEKDAFIRGIRHTWGPDTWETQWVLQDAEKLGSVLVFDSQAQASSYLAELLPDRQPMVSGILHAGALHRAAILAARPLRPLAYRLGHDD